MELVSIKVGATLYDVSGRGKPREFIEELCGFGFSVFELYLPFYGVINRDSSINTSAMKVVKGFASTLSVKEFTAHGYYDDEVGVMSNIASVDEATRRMAEKTLTSVIELCPELGVHVLCQHSGTLFPELKKSESISISFMANDLQRLGKPKGVEMAVKTLKNCVKAAEENDVLICVENEVPRLDTLPIADNPIVIPAIVEAVGSERVKATCDVGHLALAASFYGFNLITGLKLLKPYTRHIHLHDNKLIPFPIGGTQVEKGLGDLHLPPGQGSIGFKSVMETLAGVEAVYNLEVIRYKTIQDFKVAADLLRRIQGI